MKAFKENIKDPSRIALFLFVVLAFFLSDWLTKHYLFDATDSASYGNGFLGYRFFPHDNSTIFSSLHFNMPLEARITVNFVILVAFSAPIFFTRSVFLAIGLGVLVGGILGNGLDIIPAREVTWVVDGKVYSHYVRDIFYTPWMDRGTFNAADVFIVVGAGLVVVRTLIQLFKSEKK